MRKSILILFLAIVLFFVSCANKIGENNKKLKIGIVLSTGGLGDKSFNDSAYRGLEKARKELGIEFKYVEPSTPTEDSQFLKEFAEAKYDLVIGTGFTMTTSLGNVAKQFPKTKFAMIDEFVDLPNVRSLVFKEQEGSFLVGAAAAMASKTGKIGFVGGGDFPLINRFKNGYVQGAKYINPKIQLVTVFISGDNPFADPVQAKEITLSEFKQGADIVYHAAGSSGIGVINAAKETGKLAIGVDSNQDDVAPGFVLTSMIKNIDIAVFNTIKDLQDGKFKTGEALFGIKEDGVGVTDFKFTKNKIGDDNIKKLEEIKQKIISGDIVVK
ncbi:MAG: BMP family lipoprotein [Fusobacteriaceae bacterium]